MKHLVLLLAFAAPAAFASPENPCNVPVPPGVVKPYVDLLPPAAAASSTVPPQKGYRCAPAPVGTGTVPTVRSNEFGVTVWWYCPAGATWQPNWAAVTNERLLGTSLAAEAQAVLTAEKPLAALNAMAARTITLPVSDPELTPVWCPHQAAMYAGAPKVVQPVVWVVAKNAARPTRPSYAVTAGVRAKTSKTTAAVGARCDSIVAIVEGTSTYMQVAPGFVSLCTKEVTP